MRPFLFAAAASLLAAPIYAKEPMPHFTFASIDGGVIDTKDWEGHPVLVVNTASLCGFAPQLAEMEALHQTLGPSGLIVIAVPSNDFNQELDDAKKVKEYCAFEFGVTLPMTEITHVAKGEVHPFYDWIKQTEGFVPKWNFYKVLIGKDGKVVDTYSSITSPDSPAMRVDISNAM